MESPFSNRLETNYAPVDAELTQLKKLLEKPEGELSKLDLEIMRITELLNTLQQKREKFATFIDQHRALMSPIRRLPIEIMQTIFLHCISTKHNAVMCTSKAPLLLTHVCHHWRTMALNMPLLWSTIHIPIPNYPQASHRMPGFTRDQLSPEQLAVHKREIARWESRMTERRQIVEDWLRRAAGCKLSISIIQWDFNNNGQPSPLSKALVDATIPYSHQWKRLDISASRQAVLDILSLPLESVPNLEHLKVNCNPWPRPGQFPGFQSLPMNQSGVLKAPRLKSLHFKIFPENIMSLPVDWSHLTELFFEGYSSRGVSNQPLSFTAFHALDLLERCPRLIRCRLVLNHAPFNPTLPTPMTDPSPNVRPVPLHFLEYLSVYEGASMMTAFESLELPSLKEVIFQTSMLPYDEMHSSLVILLTNWGASIKKLTFDYANLTVADLQQALRLVPSLSHLSLTTSSRLPLFNPHPLTPGATTPATPATFNDARLAQLTPQMNNDEDLIRDSCFCPLLESFACRFMLPQFSEDALFDFISRRRHPRSVNVGVVHLKKITVQFATAKEVDVEKKLKEEKVNMNGLDLTITYPPMIPKGAGCFSPTSGIPPEGPPPNYIQYFPELIG